MGREKMNLKNPGAALDVDPDTGVVLTPEEIRLRREKRKNPMEEREQK